jgi:hypothetical protein
MSTTSSLSLAQKSTLSFTNKNKNSKMNKLNTVNTNNYCTNKLESTQLQNSEVTKLSNKYIYRTSTFNLNNIKVSDEFRSEMEKDNPNKERKDRKGVPIIKGKKNYKVTFLDKVGTIREIFVDKIDIESFKAYNITSTYTDGEKQKENSSPVTCCLVY